MIVSKHPCIIIKDTEFITCNQIMYSKKNQKKEQNIWNERICFINLLRKETINISKGNKTK